MSINDISDMCIRDEAVELREKMQNLRNSLGILASWSWANALHGGIRFCTKNRATLEISHVMQAYMYYPKHHALPTVALKRTE